MKVIRTASGKAKVELSKTEWLRLGQAAGFTDPTTAPAGDIGGDIGAGADAGATDPTLGTDPVDPAGDTGGETPDAKVRRTLGELQSAVEELLGGGDTSGATGADATDIGTGADTSSDLATDTAGI